MAQVLDISIGTVRSRLHHSLDKLRTRLDVEMIAD
ncbi:MAG: sigma factor-like helix-turn-helix DNA-binding protein [Planctomycetota bacterium]